MQNKSSGRVRAGSNDGSRRSEHQSTKRRAETGAHTKCVLKLNVSALSHTLGVIQVTHDDSHQVYTLADIGTAQLQPIANTSGVIEVAHDGSPGVSPVMKLGMGRSITWSGSDMSTYFSGILAFFTHWTKA